MYSFTSSVVSTFKMGEFRNVTCLWNIMIVVIACVCCVLITLTGERRYNSHNVNAEVHKAKKGEYLKGDNYHCIYEIEHSGLGKYLLSISLKLVFMRWTT